MSSMESKRVVSRFIEEVFIEHDTSRIAELVSNEELIQVAPGMLAAFPDIEMTVEDLIAEDDLVAVRVTATASHLGDLWGTPATGKRWSASASAWYRVRDERIAEYWINWDWLAIMEQLGTVQRVDPVDA